MLLFQIAGSGLSLPCGIALLVSLQRLALLNDSFAAALQLRANSGAAVTSL